MYFVGIGLAMLLMRMMDIAPVAHWPWYVVLAPFGMAVVWWTWADSSGYTQRKAAQREEERRRERIERQKESLGMLNNKRRP